MTTLDQSRHLRYGTFFYLYVMQGIPSGLALTALTNYLAAEGVDARRLATFGTVVGLPWGIKFIWGPLIDRFQRSAMGRRRPWVLGAQIMAFLASLGLLLPTDPVHTIDQLMWSFALHGVFASLQDVSVDAMAITSVPTPERGRVNALMKGGMVTGQAMGAAGLALVIHHQGFHAAALAQSTLLFVLTILTFFIRERAGDAWLSFRQLPVAASPNQPTSMSGLIGKLLRALLDRHSLIVFGSVAIVFIGERLFQRVYGLYLIREAGWTDTAVSVLSGTYGTLVALALALAGGWLSDRIGSKRLLGGMVLAMATLHVGFSLGHSGWANPAVATSGLVVRQTLEPLFSIAALPVLMGLCRPQVAGAQFAFYMALSNQADLVGIYLSGVLYSQCPSWVIGLGCGLAMLGAWLALRLLTGSSTPNRFTMEQAPGN
ncbi:MFS transporter [Spirosoma oryzicola]|uniref:MFS transporter n=1 Tax=Spirosoma oryzicola TaxID=2898794 RepID=UPI001E44F2A3|nr:MFS transporter [Spirosoma oryzicola]UHG94370.1 MFS transporter [Spirosoma oryzicola]